MIISDNKCLPSQSEHRRNVLLAAVVCGERPSVLSEAGGRWLRRRVRIFIYADARSPIITMDHGEKEGCAIGVMLTKCVIDGMVVDV